MTELSSGATFGVVFFLMYLKGTQPEVIRAI